METGNDDSQLPGGSALTRAYVELEQVHHRYGGSGGSAQVLAGTSLCVARGETVALLGRSGSGKSTLLNIVAGIERPDTGSVRIDGVDLTTASERARTLFRRRHIGFVYQFFNLIPTLTAAENVGLALELNGYCAANCRDRVEAELETLHLTAVADHFPDQLSGGEQQRVAIARALVHRPALVLADEPTGNLDAHNGAEVMRMLHQQTLTHGATLLLVTHSLAVAGEADRIMTLDRGRLQLSPPDLAW